MKHSGLASKVKTFALSLAVAAAAATVSGPASADTPAPQVAALPFSAGAVHQLPTRGLGLTNASTVNCGVQWSASIGPGQTQLWYTYDWPKTWFVNWSLLDTTPAETGRITLSNVAVDRTDPGHMTYWLTIQNLSSNTKYFSGRYCILAY